MTTLQALRRLVKPRDLVWPVLAGTITLLSALSLTVVSAWLITRSWQMPPLMDITLAVTSVRALGISRAAFRYLDRLVSHDVALRTAERSRVKLWEHFVADRTLALRERSDIVTALGANIDALADAVVRSIVPALVALMTSLIAVIFVALLSPAAAVLLAVGLLLAGGVAPYLTYRATARSSQRRAAAMQSHAAAVEALLSDAAGLRIHGQLDEAVSAASSSSKTVAAIDDAAGRANARASALSTAASVLTAVLTVVVASWLVTDSAGGAGGGLLHSPEWLTVLVLVPLAAFEAVGPLPAAAQTLAQSREALLTLASNAGESEEADAMRSSPAPTAPIHTSTLPQNHLAVRPTLQLEDLIVGYPDDNSSNTAEEPAAQPAQLPMQNFEVTFGDYREITAPSGSGKTTLLKTIAGLIPPIAGTVTIADGDGRELWRSAASAGEPHENTEQCDLVRFIAEDEHIFATTVRDNISIGNPQVSDDDIYSVLDAVGLRDWVDAAPDGLDTILDSGADSLSGGQRRRLILTRALVSTAPILLLDEPTEHLDEESNHILEILRNTTDLPGGRGRRTVIVVRHPRTQR
ncbi:thiol reductant ABC exporter subunit CydC [Corynebacterium amycolatum]|uniref:thiol reductant ABC exporter subunit CydC n=1 Tax=Corynebacterium amycolatum TaxID=43765 RepID=UPI000C771162|nr:thiol reductant ABC exporter subunit CydC [Corynebacterium amycolatum]MDK7316436.1 thiol reductant ABC exporter subunit CydC [Corynebacterium amycolatum]PKZ20125.1 thiol reductant ABC exporter subunit CydC [Corynebacterium amycolatum]